MICYEGVQRDRGRYDSQHFFDCWDGHGLFRLFLVCQVVGVNIGNRADERLPLVLFNSAAQ